MEANVSLSNVSSKTGGGPGNLTTDTEPNLNKYFSNHYAAWFWVLHAVISILTVLGNALVICVISSRKTPFEQQSPNGRFIMSLAVADLCVGIFNAPVKFMCVFWLRGCGFMTWALYSFFGNSFLNASVANLCILTCDRYIAVVHPYRHVSFNGASCSRALVAAGWFLSVALQVPDLLTELRIKKVDYLEFNVVYITCLSILPTLWMLYAYTRILLVVKRHRRQILKLESQVSCNRADNESTNGTAPKAKSRSRRARGFKAVGAVVAIFLVCNSFYLYVMACYFLTKSCSIYVTLTGTMVLLRYFNSAVNFFVYAFMRTDFQRELLRTLRIRFYPRIVPPQSLTATSRNDLPLVKRRAKEESAKTS